MKEIIKILHLEDVPEDADLIENALKRSPLFFKILVVDSRPAFIRELHRFNPDIILADHALPAFNSLEAFAILQYSGLKIPFILVTGHFSRSYVERLVNAGMDDCIFKDNLAGLPQAILNALKKYGFETKLHEDLRRKAADRLKMFELSSKS